MRGTSHRRCLYARSRAIQEAQTAILVRLTPRVELRASQIKANAQHSQILRSPVSCSVTLGSRRRDARVRESAREFSGSRVQRAEPRSRELQIMTANVAMLSPMLSIEAPERSHASCGRTRSGTTTRRMAREERIPASEDRLAATDRALRHLEADTAPARPAVTRASI